MRRVYLAGPITKPDPFQNVLIAIEFADTLLDLGFAPFVPHLSYFWQKHGEFRDDGTYGAGYEVWMKYDFVWILQCEALLRIPGYSLGADREVKFAEEHGIPVFYTIEDLLDWR